MQKMKGLVLAAGKGTRARPLTFKKPKPLLPVAGKPLIQYNLENIARAGLKDVIIVIDSEAQSIKEKLGQGEELGLNLTYVNQPKPLGTAHAVGIAKKLLRDGPFLVIYGDNLTLYDLKRLIKYHKTYRATATLALFRASDPRKHGVVEVLNGQVMRIVEKPEKPASDLSVAGMFVFEPEIFEAIERTKISQNQEYYLTDSIQMLIDWGEKVKYCLVDEWRINVNSPADLLLANRKMLEMTDHSAGQHLPNGSLILPPVYLGENVKIGSETIIGPYVSVGDCTSIGKRNKITNCILMDYVEVGDNCQLRNSILGENSQIAHGFRTGDKPVEIVLPDGEKADHPCFP